MATVEDMILLIVLTATWILGAPLLAFAVIFLTGSYKIRQTGQPIPLDERIFIQIEAFVRRKLRMKSHYNH